MKAKKIISLVMAALMLVGCSAMFISCKGSGNNGGYSYVNYYSDPNGGDPNKKPKKKQGCITRKCGG
mgnify:CR=1 FL=1